MSTAAPMRDTIDTAAPVRRTLLAAVALLALAGSAPSAAQSSAVLPGEIAGGFSVPVESFKQTMQRSRFRSTVQQQYDFSCGSAAVATLLTHHYATPTSEEEAIRAMFARGNQEKIRAEGFSLLDMKTYLAQRGFAADGFEATVEQIVQFGAPGIALIQDNGYRHFVVVKGVRDGALLLGDPALGGRILSRAEFERVWVNHVFFVIHSHRERARFNVPAQWQILPSAVLADAVSRQSLIAGTLLRLDRGREF